ncbi:Dihydrodipicolinate synthase [Bonamia ostreae]|uniref:Dihydrodipicolinate synthase n=1 Tax=Bonamia ostreae TaxID=126728 RepID=A0ABV2AQ44_9EUKA
MLQYFAIFLIILFSLPLLCKKTEKPIRKVKKENLKLNLKQLNKFNGIDDERIFISINRKIYDVSKKRTYYGPDGPYSPFAGHDATLAFAKHSLDESFLDYFGKMDLSEDEKSNLDSFLELFDSSYQIVGDLVKE